MNTKPYIAGVIALFLIALPFGSSHAATFLPLSEEVASLRSETKGDVYAASNSVVITAPVEGDIFAVGDSVDISGSSGASIFALGRTLSLSGESKDDVRVAGNMISIGSQIAHDLFAAGSSIFISQDSHVHGDAYVAGESITISGTIHGNVRAAANKVTITKDAVLMGDLIVRGNAPIIEDGATVSGKVQTIAPSKSTDTRREGFSVGRFIASVLSAAVLALLLLFSAPALVTRSKEIIQKSPAQSGIIGLIWMVLCIPVTFLLLMSGIGVYVGIFFLTVTIPLAIIAFGLMVITTGSILYRLLTKKTSTILYDALIGALVVSLVAFLGPLGFVLICIAFLIALGAVLKALWSMIQGK
jgi:cytoskeletal protein CcmA (bactofilin family)